MLHLGGPLFQLTQLRPCLVPLLLGRLAVLPGELKPLLRELLRAVGVLLLLPEGGVNVVELFVELFVRVHGGGRWLLIAGRVALGAALASQT